MRKYKIDTLLDIGANAGQYASSMRELGYAHKIISFEPLSSAYGKLKRKAKGDDNWFVNNHALGDKDGKAVINVSGNSVSSSILDLLPKHIESAADSKYIIRC
jgi:FkbM family methyltransferase